MEENDQILISWIDEYVYCPRRFYLKVLEKYDATNVYMVEGTIGHRNVDKARIEKRKDLVKIYSLEVFSKNLRIYGKCDAIECVKSESGTFIPLLEGRYTIIPIEFKHGKVRNEKEYNLQLTAQAMCIEEMYGAVIKKGYVYYLDSKERFEVTINDKYREMVKESLKDINELIKTSKPVPPIYKKRCMKCSIYDFCDPRNTIIIQYMKELKKKYYEESK